MPNNCTAFESTSQDHVNCERWKLKALKECKLVKNIISKIESSNMKFSDSCISCEYCNDAYAAGEMFYISLICKMGGGGQVN